MNQDSLIEFPCDFPVKVMGENREEFAPMIAEIARRHFGDVDHSACSSRPSSNERFVAVTIVVPAQSQTQLDGFYAELTTTDQVIMAL